MRESPITRIETWAREAKKSEENILQVAEKEVKEILANRAETLKKRKTFF